ncbi:transferase hexapeptide (six repeat-containing protein) [Fibrobacter sp. UWB15]|nr:transferase family hexapeptide repeat protein [Fibrobacter sp. UWB6]SHF97936.1 transferase hexapeptide (six repeat-containing protein) [Fibrobacter sp. UWB8]SMG23814.1 transferase hexapeptide (six repeat-containing protein) [Fibrobacter sp. UWB15]
MKKNYGIVMTFYRIERWLYVHKLKFMANIVFRLIYLIFNCYIPPSVKIGKNVEIAHGIGIVLNINCEIGDDCIIYQNVTIGNGGGANWKQVCIGGRSRYFGEYYSW